MLSDREADGPARGGPLPAHWPMLPLALLAIALLAALLSARQAQPAWLLALALLLASAGTLLCGALWSRQRQLDRLHDARLQCQLMGQLLDVWSWQTDVEHRLTRLSPPQGAPASAWVALATQVATTAAAGLSGEVLWQRFNDAAQTLQARLQSQRPLGELSVLQNHPGQGTPRHWRLRGLPRFDSRGRFVGYLGVAWPTAQEDARRNAQQGLEALLQQGPAALCLAGRASDGPGWVLQRANPAACSLLGLASAPDGRQPWDQALAGLPDGLRQQVLGLAAGQALECEGWRIRIDSIGEPWAATGADAGATAAGSADGPGCGLLLSLVPRAADAEHKAENSTENSAMAAEHAAFSYTISHDLRAPIRVIEGFGRILKEDYGAAIDRVGRDHLDRMMAAAARMNHMIDALLSVSRLSTQPLAQQSVNLSQLAQWVTDDLQRSAPERQVSVRIQPDMTAQGDPTLLRMALENLLGNAWKYSARVALGDICFELTEQAGRPVYRISDNGAGFDMRFADRLFGVFQRLHSGSDFQGTGVGLASVRRIIRRHSGEVWAEGEVGKGASFYFTLKG
jgi:signal transduction histidine kinase